ncbi:ATP-binding protein [Streptomyces fulvoviolaceus]|uniref:ATP-binding protein n=1 Tax=Streptomyces fulvoviolaceus TaxID=285535 RepID=UPI0004C919EB|nr:ATP-binding protein [Streptomyces fulvoviolaceus]MCT9075050.1 ATP-binding protein [Streptomyces fulvoviolaceus]
MNHVTGPPHTGLGPTYGLTLTLGDHSARHLRRVLRAHLHAWEMPELTDPVALALTELVSNVVRHVPDRRAALRILRRPDGVRVEVTDTDPCPPLSTAVDGADELAEGGRGLLLLDAFTQRWGWQPHHPGKTVWFECDTPPAPSGM